MKLNHECVRSVLLAVEENSTLYNMLTTAHFSEYDITKTFEADEIIYTVIKLKDAEFLTANISYFDNAPTIWVTGLTYKGHEFLDNIRDNKVWEKTKEKIGSSATSVSISIIGQVAGSVIKGMMGLT